MTLWRSIDSGPGTASANMAIDEDLLRRAQNGDRLPVLRFYTWNPPALSLGRFQKTDADIDADQCARHGIDIVQRITGGRAVLHNKELTYSVVSPIDNPLFPQDVLGTYRVIAGGLVAGLRLLGIPAEIVSRSEKYSKMVQKNSKDPACFSSPSWYEIVVHGKKIIGSAQRRVPGAFLQHGSLLLDYDPFLESKVMPGGDAAGAVTWVNRELRRDAPVDEVKAAMRKGFERALGVSFAE